MSEYPSFGPPDQRPLDQSPQQAPPPPHQQPHDLGQHQPAPGTQWPAYGTPAAPAYQPPSSHGPRPWLHIIGYPAAVVVALLLGFVIGQSGGDDSADIADGPATSTTAAPSAVANPLASGASPGASPSAPAVNPGGGTGLPDGVFHFGDTAKISNGSTVVVGNGAPFTRSEYAAGGEGFKDLVKFKITYTNNTKAVVDPSLTSVRISSGDQEGEQVFQEDLSSPRNKLLPGKSVSWYSGFGVQDSTKLTVTVSIDLNTDDYKYDDVIFTNEA